MSSREGVAASEQGWTPERIGYLRGVVASTSRLVTRQGDFAGPLTDYWRSQIESLLDALEEAERRWLADA